MTSNIVELLTAQATEIDELNRIIRNYKADGPTRKTTRYLKDKLRTFDDAYNVISANHDIIISKIEDNQPYIVEKTFETLTEKYIATREDILQRLNPENSPQQPEINGISDKTTIDDKETTHEFTKENDDLSFSSTHQEENNAKNGQSTSANEHQPKPGTTTKAQSSNANQSNANTTNAVNNVNDTLSNLLQVQYDDIMDIIATSRDINETSSPGTIKVHMELLNGMWTEIRKLVYEYKSTGRSICFNYTTLLSKYMDVTSKLTDFLQPNSSSRSESIRTNPQFSLPKIELPKFSGKSSEWKGFIALFDRMIHNNVSLDRGIKIEYLKSCVKDSAAKIINHLDPTPENYDTCYALLRKRYENKRELVGCLLDNIIYLPKLKFENSEFLKTMHDTVYESLMAIKNLGVENDQLFGHLITHILIKKLDPNTLIHYECQLEDVKQLPKIESFLSYVENRFMALQSVGAKNNSMNNSTAKHNAYEKTEKSYFEKKYKCLLCNGEHALYKCYNFIKKTPYERANFVREKKLCSNCFSIKHNKPQDCPSKFTCKTCNKPHHSLLHFESNKTVQSHAGKVEISQSEPVNIQSMVTLQKSGSVLLATAMIGVLAKNGTRVLLHALLDQGSQSAFIKETAAQTLGLSRNNISAIISGIGAKKQYAKHSIDLTIFPRFESEFILQCNAIVLPELTKCSHYGSDKNEFNFVNNLTLADPSFLNEVEIDIILGAAEYAQALKMGLIKSDNNIIAQNSEFGWIVSGAINRTKSILEVKTLVTNVELTEQMNRFFSTDEFNNVDGEALTEEEAMCETHYAATHFRDDTGRYVVSLPFKNGAEKPDLGNSKQSALAALFSMERRFISKPELKIQYSEFLNEYINAGHMKEVTVQNDNAYYMPHHCVFKESTTTKLRVVFNASQKTSNKKSLNEQLALGSMDQNDLTTILLRWRCHKIAFTADVEKMYRQILVNEQQTHLQRILWRESPKMPIKEYELTTVTYGTANAPYLAIRTLNQLAIDGEKQFPMACNVIKTDFYVDDVLSGANSVEKARDLYAELKSLMNSACFNLRKWTSNSSELLKTIPSSDRELQAENGMIKTLGVTWSPQTDDFKFNLSIQLDDIPNTKRQLTSEVASLYDPLGWFSPVVIMGKHILQLLWAEKLDWDQPISNNHVQSWLKIKNELNQLKNISIPRWISYSPNEPMELHGFCDASNVGYAVAVYVKNNLTKTSYLLTGKARVCPIKETSNCDNVTTPRLELCGALMLAQIIRQILTTIDIDFKRIRLWSDSRIVLDWIHANPKRYKVFIASRITKINKLAEKSWWSHVRSEDNPADCASRGLLPSELVTHSLWWNGPKFLIDETLEPPRYQPSAEINEEKECIVANTVKKDDVFSLPDLSSYDKLKRVISYCFRFTFNCRNKNKRIGAVTPNELNVAETAIIKIVQRECFASEIMSLQTSDTVKNTSALLRLSPFLDNKQILRVGGRLKNADIPYEAKHQILLPNKHAISQLIIKNVHLNCLHGPPKLTETVLKQKYWILHSQRAIKSFIHKCVNCFRVNPRPMNQFMANLPSTRINPSEKPFANTAVDYTGAFLVKLSNGRGFKSHKCYVAIFVCMATRAMHIELVSDLTAEAFIAAYRRLVARRGVIRNLYSDNGTNFIKSNKILTENMQNIDNAYDIAICEELSKSGTRWHFSPPGAPHFNGLAESAVKIVKKHIKKTISESILTFEELSTLLTQIEACVNSRPLCELSTDPNDVGVLTPAHFLVGESLISPPEQNHLEAKVSWLTRWQRVQQMTQYFWKRWQNDYLNQLQTRTKWFKEGKTPELNDLVLIRDENLPSTQWQTGRVIELCAFPNEEVACQKPEINIRSHISNIRIAKQNQKANILPILTAILAIFTTLTHQSPIPQEPFVITRFKSAPGFYFEKSSDVFMTNTDWNVVVNLNLVKLDNEFSTIKQNLQSAGEFCFRKALINSGCRNVVSRLKMKLDYINTKNSLLLVEKRTRRSIPTLHYIGDIFGDLFGTLGSKFEDTYKNDLLLINKNQDHLLALLKNHTSLIDSTLNFIKHGESERKKHVDSFTEFANSISNHTQTLEIESNVQSFLIYLSLVIGEFEQQQEAIFDAITGSKRDHISHKLFTPTQVEEQIEAISRQVGTEFRVPSGMEVYSVSKISVYRIKNQYVFKISIPLLKPQKFKLYKIISVPTIYSNKFFWINNEHKLLLTSVDRQLFQYIDNTFNCIPYENKRALICDKPTQWFTAGKSSCVWDIFNHISKEKCVIDEKPMNIFFESLNNNMFIFTIPDSYKITIICKDEVTHNHLSGEGILSLRSDCSLGSDTVRLLTKEHYGNVESEIVVPHMEHYNWTLSRQINVKYMTHDAVKNISQLQLELNRTTENLYLHKNNVESHNIHHYSIIYIVFSIVIIFFVFNYFKFKQQMASPIIPPVPMPRLSIVARENVDTAT